MPIKANLTFVFVALSVLDLCGGVGVCVWVGVCEGVCIHGCVLSTNSSFSGFQRAGCFSPRKQWLAGEYGVLQTKRPAMSSSCAKNVSLLKKIARNCWGKSWHVGFRSGDSDIWINMFKVWLSFLKRTCHMNEIFRFCHTITNYSPILYLITLNFMFSLRFLVLMEATSALAWQLATAACNLTLLIIKDAVLLFFFFFLQLSDIKTDTNLICLALSLPAAAKKTSYYCHELLTLYFSCA